jgi:hypothetical protein
MLNFKAHSPAKDTNGVSRTSPIYFEISSDSSELDVSSVNIFVNSVLAIYNGNFQPGFTGSILKTHTNYCVYISHTDIWIRGSEIIVEISVNDVGGNNYSETYSFIILTTDIEDVFVIANPKSGIFASTQNILLQSNKPNTLIYYTLDESIPNTSSMQYTVPISLEENTIIKFFAIDEDNNKSEIYVESYKFDFHTVNNSVPITTLDKQSGTYDNLMTITLTTNKPATIYWTINGDNPTEENFHGKDSSPVMIDLSFGKNDIRYFAIDFFGNVEQIKFDSFLIQSKENNVVPSNVFVTSPYIKNTIDICWDDVSIIEPNVIGYNIYRSQVSPRYLKNSGSHDVVSANSVLVVEDGNFVKLNQSLITSNFYRDQWLNKVIVQEDVSKQFKFKTEIDNINFDGQIVNNNYWEIYDPHRLIHQSNGLHFVDVYGNSRESEIRSKFRISDNFDVQTDFTILNWPITHSLYKSEIGIKLHFNKFTYLSISRIRIESTDYYESKLVVDSNIISEKQMSLNDLNGKFRFTRFNSDVTTSYHDGVNWILIDSYLGFSKDDLQIVYFVQSSNQVLSVDFTNFSLLSGKALLPLINDSLGQYIIKTQHRPIATTETRNYNLYSDDINNVTVMIDNKKAVIKSVDGIKGEITLNTEKQFDNILGKWIKPQVPTAESIITITYPFLLNSFKLNLSHSPYYKVTCVLSNNSETILNICEPITIEADKVDYMYQEAIRRNAWLLDQVGERVLLFKRKSAGKKCECYEKNERTHKQAKVGPCKICWGTGIVGGYDGPFEIKIAPAQNDQKISMTERGMKLENTENTWTGISPNIDQRDFVLRKKFQIFAIGPVSVPEIRGITTQQHFQIEYVDSTDIRYEFLQSINFNSNLIGLQKSNIHYTENDSIKNGEVTNSNILRTDKTKETDKPKGRTITFENTLY